MLLGEKIIEGVSAVGSRLVSSIQPGDLGDRRPIRPITLREEQWFQPRAWSDRPEQTTYPHRHGRDLPVRQIVRTEPDPNLFVIPSDYTQREMNSRATTTFGAPTEMAPRSPRSKRDELYLGTTNPLPKAIAGERPLARVEGHGAQRIVADVRIGETDSTGRAAGYGRLSPDCGRDDLSRIGRQELALWADRLCEAPVQGSEWVSEFLGDSNVPRIVARDGMAELPNAIRDGSNGNCSISSCVRSSCAPFASAVVICSARSGDAERSWTPHARAPERKAPDRQ